MNKNNSDSLDFNLFKILTTFKKYIAHKYRIFRKENIKKVNYFNKNFLKTLSL